MYAQCTFESNYTGNQVCFENFCTSSGNTAIRSFLHFLYKQTLAHSTLFSAEASKNGTNWGKQGCTGSNGESKTALVSFVAPYSIQQKPLLRGETQQLAAHFLVSSVLSWWSDYTLALSLWRMGGGIILCLITFLAR